MILLNIHHNQFANAASGQHFGYDGADATNANHDGALLSDLLVILDDALQ
jgi:hypothetical protein